MTTPAFDAFQQKFRVADLAIVRTKFWTWSVRPVQGTLGASIISLNRPATAWSDTSSEEGADLATLITRVEQKVKAAFAYSKINYLMLMMVDDHVHFHVFPRYATSIEFANREWIDSNWPKPPDLLNGDADPELLAAVKATLA